MFMSCIWQHYPLVLVLAVLASGLVGWWVSKR